MKYIVIKNGDVKLENVPMWGNHGLTWVQATILLLYYRFIVGLEFLFITFLLLSTHSHDPCQWGESDVPAYGPPASFFVHLTSSAVSPAGSVHKSSGDNVGAVEEIMCVMRSPVLPGTDVFYVDH